MLAIKKAVAALRQALTNAVFRLHTKKKCLRHEGRLNENAVLMFQTKTTKPAALRQALNNAELI